MIHEFYTIKLRISHFSYYPRKKGGIDKPDILPFSEYKIISLVTWNQQIFKYSKQKYENEIQDRTLPFVLFICSPKSKY